jgi:hypothetical protein
MPQKQEGGQLIETLKRELGKSLQMSLMQIIKGCHKPSRASRTTFTLRSFLYSNLSEIIENIAEFIDADFLMQILKPIIEQEDSKTKSNQKKNNQVNN